MDTRAPFSWILFWVRRAGLAGWVVRLTVALVATAALCSAGCLAQGVASGPVGFAGCKPVSERTGEAGAGS